MKRTPLWFAVQPVAATIVPVNGPVTEKSLVWRIGLKDAPRRRAALFGWAAPAADRFATSAGTLFVQTLMAVPRTSPAPEFSRPTSRIAAVVSVYSPLVSEMDWLVMSGTSDAVTAPLAAMTVAAMVTAPGLAMAIPVQVAFELPMPLPTPDVPPADAMQVTPVTVPLVKATAAAKSPVAVPVWFVKRAL